MNLLRHIAPLSLLITLTSCALGPIHLQETARSVGEGKHEFTGSGGYSNYSVKWNYGLSRNWDIGTQVEVLGAGLRTKYSFLNQKEGLSMAMAAGTGLNMGGSHYYGDFITSYSFGTIEPYASFRAVTVNTDKKEFKDDNTGNILFVIDDEKFSYGQVFLGTRIWFNPKFFLSAELTRFISLSGVREIENNIIGAVGLGVKL